MRSPVGLRQSRKVTSPPSSSFANDWLPCKDSMDIKAYPWLVHQVRGWYSGAAAYFGWMREAKRENTRCGLRPMSDKAAGRKTRGPEGCDENGPAAALLLGHVPIQICSLVAPCRRPILIATPLYQSRTWCTRSPATSARACAGIPYSDRRRHEHSCRLTKGRSVPGSAESLF